MSDLNTLLKGKTPVSFLQEICSRKKLTPSYDVLANEGPIHEPVFVMRAQAGDFQGTGKGSSKKKAKHHAAEDLLRNMYNIKESEADSQTSESTIQKSQSDAAVSGDQTAFDHVEAQLQTGAFDGDTQGNPIGELQEYTQKNLIKPPIYEFIGEEGPPHAREFVCTIKLAKLQETAVGKSKKIAKRAAASKMLQAIQQHVSDNTNSNIVDEDEDDLPLPNGVANFKTLTIDGGKQAAEFFEKHRLSPGPNGGTGLQYLPAADLKYKGDNFGKLLDDAAKLSKFEVSYLDVKEKSYSGQYQCLVQISTSPVGVCFGMGETPAEARSNAAYNTLQYLRLVTT